MKKNNFENLVVEKPWGYEYVIYSNKKLCITYLNILHNHSTSLHCHPSKKTGFILLSGTVEIQLGFYNRENSSAPSKTIIRPGLFHATKALSQNGAIILELETPIDKNDIVRFKDNYGREKDDYQGSSQLTEITKDNLIFEEPDFNSSKKYVIGGVEILLEKHKDMKILSERSLDTIISIIDGGIRCKKTKQIVLGLGEVIKTGTMIKLSEVFEVDEFVTTLSVKSII